MDNKSPIITIIYRDLKYFHLDSEYGLFFWLKNIKSVMDYEQFQPREFRIQIDTATIDYEQIKILWSLFRLYMVKGREQLEELLPYLPKNDAEKFDKYFLKPWKSKKLKNKEIIKQTDNESPIITIIYNRPRHGHRDGKEAFFFWLGRVKAYKGCKGFHPSELHVYIDPKEIDYMQMISLWWIFKIYRVKGREQLEQLLPYLPPEDAADFGEGFLKPWEKRKLKSKKNLKSKIINEK